ncbi:MAG TPA: CPBP family intramembrane glutamic endopeptidase [Candidatus Eisenbacteria bacterium]|nr:CPBP family intramembrane glutamic endopeptidase [Candidatus Eisenbacteria bacterium]
MNSYDDTSQEPEQAATNPEGKKPSDENNATLAETPPNWFSEGVGSQTEIETAPQISRKSYPADLQISWSWAHFIVLVVFGFVSLVVVQGVLAVIYGPHQRMPTKELEDYLISKPQFAIGSMLLWYAAIFFFLYVTLSVLRGHPFWKTLGWRKLVPMNREMPTNPLAYLLAGAGLSLVINLLTAHLKTPENIPMEELFKHRQTALLFVGMAVLVAPLVEETLFRGYLYPMFARAFGITPGILVTGFLFGLMHGAQLGWTWSLVALLTVVGIALTFVRARTGTVVASFLMHLGYNGLIAVAALVSTHGFTTLPAGT